MFNVIVVIFSLVIGALLYKLHLEHKVAIKRKEWIKFNWNKRMKKV